MATQLSSSAGCSMRVPHQNGSRWSVPSVVPFLERTTQALWAVRSQCTRSLPTAWLPPLTVCASGRAWRPSVHATEVRSNGSLAGHPGVEEIHLIPAVPAPAAVAIGLDRMPKAHPRLVVYDKRGNAGFERTIVVGERWGQP